MPTALITGSGVHLGSTLAECFAQAGYDLIIHAYHAHKQLDALCQKLTAEGVKVTAVIADLSTAEGQNHLCKRAQEVCESLDVLIHNAACFHQTPYEAVTRNNLKDTMALNFEAPFFITQMLLEKLKQAKAPCVLSILDIAVHRPYKGYAAYTCSKGALETLTRCLALELAPYIRVNAIAPYVVMYEGHIEEALQDKFIENTPLRRNSTPEEIASAALFIAQHAPYMTGHILTLDGGRSVKP